MKKTLIITGIATLALLGSIGSLANAQSSTNIQKNGQGHHNQSGDFSGDFKGAKKRSKFGNKKNRLTAEQMTAIQNSIKNNNYNAYVVASGTGGHIPSTGEFANIVTKYTKEQSKKTAITNNDYNAYVAATTPTQDQFAKMIVNKKTKDSIKTTITNNDYNAFLSAIKNDPDRLSTAKTITQDQFENMVKKNKNKLDNGFDFGKKNHGEYKKGMDNSKDDN